MDNLTGSGWNDFLGKLKEIERSKNIQANIEQVAGTDNVIPSQNVQPAVAIGTESKDPVDDAMTKSCYLGFGLYKLAESITGVGPAGTIWFVRDENGKRVISKEIDPMGSILPHLQTKTAEPANKTAANSGIVKTAEDPIPVPAGGVLPPQPVPQPSDIPAVKPAVRPTNVTTKETIKSKLELLFKDEKYPGATSEGFIGQATAQPGEAVELEGDPKKGIEPYAFVYDGKNWVDSSKPVVPVAESPLPGPTPELEEKSEEKPEEKAKRGSKDWNSEIFKYAVEWIVKNMSFTPLAGKTKEETASATVARIMFKDAGVQAKSLYSGTELYTLAQASPDSFNKFADDVFNPGVTLEAVSEVSDTDLSLLSPEESIEFVNEAFGGAHTAEGLTVLKKFSETSYTQLLVAAKKKMSPEAQQSLCKKVQNLKAARA